jgi:hypothetical protein
MVDSATADEPEQHVGDQVLVTPIANEAARLATSHPRVRMPGDTLLVTVKTRKAS